MHNQLIFFINFTCTYIVGENETNRENKRIGRDVFGTANRNVAHNSGWLDADIASTALLPLLKKSRRTSRPRGRFARPLTPRIANDSIDTEQISPTRSQRRAALFMFKSRKIRANTTTIIYSQKYIARSLLMIFRM